MRAKLILETPRETLQIATFKNQNEAFICASLLQAKVNSPDFNYWVEFKEKGTNKRRQPNSLLQVIGTLANNQLEQLSKLF